MEAVLGMPRVRSVTTRAPPERVVIFASQLHAWQLAPVQELRGNSVGSMFYFADHKHTHAHTVHTYIHTCI